MRLAIIIPVLNEAGAIAVMLARLAPLRARNVEIIVVDGGSSDGSAAEAAPYADRVLHSQRGRALQMNAGAACAKGDALLFLHADTSLPPDADRLVAQALAGNDGQGGCEWGRFDVAISGSHPALPVIAAMMNWRSRVSGIATGDQAMFVRRSSFERVGGFAALPLMEDIELSKRLKRSGAPACLRQRVTTSGRRWERHGVWRTVWLMWRLRLAYALGADPQALALQYGYRP